MSVRGTPLRGAVAERFGTCTEFAKALRWSNRKTRDIVSGRQTPNQTEIMQMAQALKVLDDPPAFMALFFAQTVHKMDT